MSLESTIRQARISPRAALPAQSRAINRRVYNAFATKEGKLFWQEGDEFPKHPIPVVEVLNNLEIIYNFYEEVFDHKGIDGKNSALEAVIGYSDDMANAFWDGEFLLFGNGDGEALERFTQDLGVCAHEYNHGVVGSFKSLDYQGESGAIDESLADVFAACCIQWLYQQTAEEASWLIGDRIWSQHLRSGTVKAVRNLLNPGSAYDNKLLGKDPQPATYQDRYQGNSDYGGVHINSGIANRAFAEAALYYGGYSWKSVGMAWWQTLPKLKPDIGFSEFAKLTKKSAASLSSKLERAVDYGWGKVGL